MVISIPHSGEELYKWGDYIHNNNDIADDIDRYVHKLIDIEYLNSKNISIIFSNLSRIVIDLNRPRSQSFFHWRKTTRGNIIYKDGYRDIERDLTLYDEYYNLLKTLSNDKILLVDLHSMPNITKDFHRIKNPNQSDIRPEICISDGGNENDTLINKARDIFSSEYEVSINDPYLGGNITTSMKGFYKETLQIEINRSLYMNEDNKEFTNGDMDISKLLEKFKYLNF